FGERRQAGDQVELRTYRPPGGHGPRQPALELGQPDRSAGLAALGRVSARELGGHGLVGAGESLEVRRLGRGRGGGLRVVEDGGHGRETAGVVVDRLLQAGQLVVGDSGGEGGRYVGEP